MSHSSPAHANRPVALWLFSCAFMVFAMVVIGGLTRLTASGLSIVEWKPIAGILPPLNAESWLAEFAKYQQSPEYRHVNLGMSLDEFKAIFFLEYLHRLIGRVAGLVFLLPFLYFIVTKKLEKRLIAPFFGIFLLGGLQGLIGWYMVKSGLVNDPHVSHYRLALHLAMAFILEGALLWAALSMWYGSHKLHFSASKHLFITLLLVFLQVVSGAFVAGLHAGLIYNTFPLMDGHLIPRGIASMEPWYKNLLENITTVQFIHRLFALIVTFSIVTLWIKAQFDKYYIPIKNSINFLMIMLIIQLTLGIATLILQVPIPLASLHQAGAMVLFSISIYCFYRMNALKNY